MIDRKATSINFESILHAAPAIELRSVSTKDTVLEIGNGYPPVSNIHNFMSLRIFRGTLQTKISPFAELSPGVGNNSGKGGYSDSDKRVDVLQALNKSGRTPRRLAEGIA